MNLPQTDDADASKAIMRTWLDQHGQTAPVPGTQREAPGNSPSPRSPSQLASGHDANGQYQAPMIPVPLASLCTCSGEGPLASSIAEHQGRAQVQVMDQDASSNPTLRPQLAARAPSGSPSRTAPGA